MNDSDESKHFSVITNFLREHEDYTPNNREEYERFKKQLKDLNKPLKNMNRRVLRNSVRQLVRKKNKELTDMYLTTRKRFYAAERSKGLVDITSPKVRAYLDEFNLMKTASNTPLPQPTPSHIETKQEAVPDAQPPLVESTAEATPAKVSCKSCFGRIRKTKKNENYDEFYGGKRRRNKKKTRKKRGKRKTRKKRGGEKSKKIKKLTKIFQQYPKIFPSGYFRFLAARLENHLNKNTLWYRNGVVLTWIQYKKTVKKTPKCIVKPGDVKLDQIVNKNQGNGAAKKVVLQFLKKFRKNRIWLEVRANNKRAIRFYRKNGFKKVCNIKFGEIPGIMMVKN